MSEPSAPPTPPPAGPPPPPAPPSGSAQGKEFMIVLAYFGPLAIVPLLVEKEDAEVQWHAKHGLVLLVFWIVLAVALGIVTTLAGPLGCLVSLTLPVLGLAILVIHIICIVKGINGQRFILPGISQYADRF